MKQQAILNTIQHQLTQLTSWSINIDLFNHNIEGIDGLASIISPVNGQEIKFLIELKNEIRNTDLLKLSELQKKHNNLLLLAQYIPKPIREELRLHKINYMESSGNAFIEKDSLLLFIDNQKTITYRQSNNSKLNTDSGMRYVYSLFLNPELIHGTYRQMANEAEIALGNVGKILEALTQEGYIQIRGEKKVLKNVGQLFDVWANAFVNTQRPYLFQRRLSFVNKQDKMHWKNLLHTPDYWGGEPAANLLDGFLNPETLLLYSLKTLKELMKEYRLVPDDLHGDILYMLPPFKDREIKKDKLQADPYIIYAELIQSKDSRCLEAAQRIKEKYIEPILKDI